MTKDELEKELSDSTDKMDAILAENESLKSQLPEKAPPKDSEGWPSETIKRKPNVLFSDGSTASVSEELLGIYEKRIGKGNLRVKKVR